MKSAGSLNLWEICEDVPFAVRRRLAFQSRGLGTSNLQRTRLWKGELRFVVRSLFGCSAFGEDEREEGGRKGLAGRIGAFCLRGFLVKGWRW